MKHAFGVLCAAFCAVSLLSIWDAGPGQAQDKPAVVRTEILHTDLEGLKDLEGIMYVTDVAPGGLAPRHTHPGYEFNYVLKGALTFEPDGEAPFTLKPGQAAFNPRDHVHKVSNASATEPAQLVVVLIHEKGKPLAIPAN